MADSVLGEAMQDLHGYNPLKEKTVTDPERMKMCWIDLETTGLDAYEEVPLELGLKITDEVGFVLAKNSWLIHDDTSSFDEKIADARDHEIVGPMHEASGLWHDLQHRETMTYNSIFRTDHLVVKWLEENGVPEGLPMCGNSIGSLDRPFVLAHFPALNQYLSYRNIDMSSLKEICKMVNPGLYENLKPIIGTKADADHRVMGDIDASIIEYRAYLDNFLFTE